MTSILKPFRRLFSPVQPIAAGIYHYQAPPDDPRNYRMHLRLEHGDGSVSTIVSDESWRANTGPVYLDGIRAGEYYDARRELPGWSVPGFDDRSWKPAEVLAGPAGVLAAQMLPPMRVQRVYPPVQIREPRPGVFVLDFGQTIAGWARLRAFGPCGTKVTMRYAERVDSTGMIERSAIST